MYTTDPQIESNRTESRQPAIRRAFDIGGRHGSKKKEEPNRRRSKKTPPTTRSCCPRNDGMTPYEKNKERNSCCVCGQEAGYHRLPQQQSFGLTVLAFVCLCFNRIKIGPQSSSFNQIHHLTVKYYARQGQGNSQVVFKPQRLWICVAIVRRG